MSNSGFLAYLAKSPVIPSFIQASVLLLSAQSAYSLDQSPPETSGEAKQSQHAENSTSDNSRTPFPLKPYKDNYVLFFSTRSDVKFQFSFQYRLFSADLSKHPIYTKGITQLFFGYTQKSIWDTWDNSAPFEDHNFNPEIFWCSNIDGCGNRLLSLSKEEIDKRRYHLRIGAEHESNGKDGDDSRAWNRIYVKPTYMRNIGDGTVFISPKVWAIVSHGSENNDIEDYLGYFDLNLRYLIKNKFNVSTTLRRGSEEGSVLADLSFPLRQFALTERFNAHLYFQYFDGYGEDLIRYNKDRQVFRAGLRLF